MKSIMGLLPIVRKFPKELLWTGIGIHNRIVSLPYLKTLNVISASHFQTKLAFRAAGVDNANNYNYLCKSVSSVCIVALFCRFHVMRGMRHSVGLVLHSCSGQP